MQDALQRLRRAERDILLSVRLGHHSIEALARFTGRSVQQTEAIFASALTNLMVNLDHPRRRWWRRCIPWI